MINIRFHVVSLVAVFLALGVGVAMGASFIDRATVDSMRGRVDDLESGFRDRGDQLSAYGSAVAERDEAALELTAEGSRAIDGVLEGQSLVLVTPTGTPDDTSEILLDILANAGGSVVGTVELQPALSPELVDGELTPRSIEALEAAIGVQPPDSGDQADPVQQADPAELVALARSVLAQALATLSVGSSPASEPSQEPQEEQLPGTTEESTSGSSTTATDTEGGADQSGGSTDTVASEAATDEARAVLERFSEAGLLSFDQGGLPAESAFPVVSGVRYLTVLSTASDPSGAEWMVPFVEVYGSASAASMLVAGVGETRDVGELPDRAEAVKELADLLEPLRSGPASNEVTTVEPATEPLARLSVVYGLQAAAEGIVGHYGLGEGAAVPYPPTVQE